MCSKLGLICKEEVTEALLLDVAQRLESGEIKKFQNRSGPKRDAFRAVSESMFQENSKECPEEGGGKDTALFNTILYFEAFRC